MLGSRGLVLGRRIAALAGAAALCAPSAPVRADPPRNPGPDLIVGDIPDATSYGQIGGVYVYDLGTISCNAGNTNLRWQGGSPNHPVIAQNIYRYRTIEGAGRFEQIGMSWVKHGFYAFSQSLCSTCNGQGGSVLGVGCSDPYDGGLNGDQASLGPRSEINASTGLFPYSVPHPWAPITDASSRRIRINAPDLDPALNTGTQYFGEALCVSPDDAPAGSGWNNGAYRALTVGSNPANYALAPSGPTTRARPALWAWKAIEPGVRIAGFDVPSDGRFLVAHQVTPLATPGVFHYEYAVLNLNSDRAGGSLVVPFPPGTAITNAGFRAIQSHSGEPYSNDPWTITIGESSITFATQPYLANANANALRWGTMYNFRFDADAAPADGALTVGMFKPAPPDKPGSFALAARTPGGAIIAAPTPGNDECSGAVPLHSGENRSSTLGAMNSATAVPIGSCTPILSDVWFTCTFTPYAPNCSGSITIDTCGSEFDTALEVYAADACPFSAGVDSPIACNDNAAPGTCDGAGASSVSFPASEGATYLIRVGSPTGARGNLILNVAAPFCIAPMGACCATNGSCQLTPGAASCFSGTFHALGAPASCSPNPCPLPPPPINDHCDGAIVVGDSLLGYLAPEGTNFQADNTVNDVCPFGVTGLHDVWYAYTPAQSAMVTIDTCIVPAAGVPMDTMLSIHESACDGPLIGCNDDNPSGMCANTSLLSLPLSAGTMYYIRVAGYFTDTGNFVLRITGGGGTPPPTTGACCWGATCTVASPADCTGPARAFVGLNTTCNSPGNLVTPCCAADFNHSGGVSVQDIFDYLDAWFARSPGAAVGGSPTQPPVLGVQQIFDFLDAWFAGC